MEIYRYFDEQAYDQSITSDKREDTTATDVANCD